MAYQEFRKQLDTVLRTKDPKTVRQFLLAQGQWAEGDTIDSERAMWLMIAGSPALQELHNEAFGWLVSHGYQSEAEALQGQARPPAKQQKPPRQARPQHSSAKGKTASRKFNKGSHQPNIDSKQ